MRHSIADLVESAIRLDRAADDVNRANERMSDLRSRIASEMESDAVSDSDRTRWLALQSMANSAISAAYSGNHLGLGEHQRDFKEQLRSVALAQLNPEQERMLAAVREITEGPESIFERRRQRLNLALSAENALFRIRFNANVLTDLVTRFAKQTEAFLDARRQETQASITLTKMTILVLGLASVGLALASASFVSSHVTRNISRVSAAMTRLAAGDLRSRLPRNGTSPDEIGELFRAFRTFRANALRLNRTHQQLRQRSALLETMFENMTDGIVVTDEAGKVTFSNGHVARMLRIGENTPKNSATLAEPATGRSPSPRSSWLEIWTTTLRVSPN